MHFAFPAICKVVVKLKSMIFKNKDKIIIIWDLPFLNWRQEYFHKWQNQGRKIARQRQNIHHNFFTYVFWFIFNSSPKCWYYHQSYQKQIKEINTSKTKVIFIERFNTKKIESTRLKTLNLLNELFHYLM